MEMEHRANDKRKAGKLSSRAHVKARPGPATSASVPMANPRRAEPEAWQRATDFALPKSRTQREFPLFRLAKIDCDFRQKASQRNWPFFFWPAETAII
jgi:hypothetical protein